jgi:hypothetical protein
MQVSSVLFAVRGRESFRSVGTGASEAGRHAVHDRG